MHDNEVIKGSLQELPWYESEVGCVRELRESVRELDTCVLDRG